MLLQDFSKFFTDRICTCPQKYALVLCKNLCNTFHPLDDRSMAGTILKLHDTKILLVTFNEVLCPSLALSQFTISRRVRKGISSSLSILGLGQRNLATNLLNNLRLFVNYAATNLLKLRLRNYNFMHKDVLNLTPKRKNNGFYNNRTELKSDE